MTRSEIVGRDTELDILSRFFERPAHGQRALVLEGAAGIGKSTLWLAGVDVAQTRGTRVLSSRPAEAERELAFAGLGDLFEDALHDVLPSLTPPRRRALEVALLVEDATEPADPRALGVAVRTALERLAVDEPLVLAIDDVQWLDASSARVLSFALRRLDAGIQLLFARRLDDPIDSSRPDAALPRELVQQLSVGPLSVGAIQAVLRSRLDRVFARPTLLRIHELSGGNPFYALELGRALPRDVDPTKPLPLPDSLGELVSARVALLPATTRRALALAAALGNVSDTVLGDTGVSRDALEPAVAAHVVTREDGVTRFTHPLLASAVYHDVSDEERRDLHRRIAEVSEDVLERAHHLALATVSPNGEVAALLESASIEARARGTSIAAAEFAEHALRLTPPDALEDGLQRTIAAARSHLEAGDMRRARVLAGEAMDRANANARADALVLLSDVAQAAGDTERALTRRREALDAAAERPRLQGEIHRWLAGTAALVESTESCSRHALAALELANSLDDDELRAGALGVLAHLHFRNGEADAAQLLEEAVELAAATKKPELHRFQVSAVIHAAVWSHDLARARLLLNERDREWNERDELVKAWNLWFRGLLELRAGHFGLAAALAAQAREIRGQYELDGRESMQSVWLVALIAAHRGEFGSARALLDDYPPSTEGTWLDGVRGLVELWSGHPGPAVACFERAESGTVAVRGEEPALSWWRADYAEALLKLGLVEEAVTLLDAREADSARLSRDALLAEVTRCRGLVAASRGHLAEADATLEQAVAQLEAVGDPFGQARASLALGIVRRRARQRRAAREAIEEAARLFEECGADGWAEKARAEVGRIGGRRREEGLTAAERRVAALVAEGRTNREVATALFLGERTVETHLSHIYSKLGVRSRTELARVFEPTSGDGAQSSGVSSISS